MTGTDIDHEVDREAVLFRDSTSPILDHSEINKFFAGANVFLTGATGFLGKVLIEKLLRSCSDLNRIYILVRPKKGKDIQIRMTEQFNDPLYDVLKKQQPNFSQKVVVMAGDASEINLGLSNTDRETLINEVNIVFHAAATVRFDEKLKTVVSTNIRGTRDALRLAREMRHLKSFVHVSTAYSNCVVKDIEEKFYPAPIPWDKLIEMTETLDEDLLIRMTPAIIGEYPNTYAFSKAVSESTVKDLSTGLPVAMVRPAIVIATANEPIVGWIDNVYGPTGVVLGAAMGLIHTLHADKDIIAEMVPVDYVANSIIAVSWYTGSHKENYEVVKENSDDKIGDDTNGLPIYNYVSSEQAPITWGEFMKYNERYAPTVPSDKIIWSYCFTLNKYRFMYLIHVFLLHTIPAHIVDAVLYCIGKQPMLIKGYQKINKFSSVISYFSTQKWKFSNKNTQQLFQKLNPVDKEIFMFDMGTFLWEDYFPKYVRGLRLYLLKDPLETIPQGAKKVYKMRILHYTLCAILGLLFLRFLWVVGSLVIKLF